MLVRQKFDEQMIRRVRGRQLTPARLRETLRSEIEPYVQVDFSLVILP